MSSLGQIPTDYKKYFDQTLHNYLPKVNPVRELFNQVNVDSADLTPEYVRQTQSYATAKGWTSFDDPIKLADGTNPTIDSIGTEDATGTVVSYGKGFRVDRKLLGSSKPIVQQYLTQHTIEMVKIIENYVNRTLITNMASNASQTYSASATWATTGDPVSDINSAMNTFKQQSGGLDADFMLLNPNEYTDVKNDFRFQSTLYVNEKQLETGKIAPRPFGLDFIQDTAVTTGSFFLGKKGMFNPHPSYFEIKAEIIFP